jgi:colicin import membrane protein
MRTTIAAGLGILVVGAITAAAIFATPATTETYGHSSIVAANDPSKAIREAIAKEKVAEDEAAKEKAVAEAAIKGEADAKEALARVRDVEEAAIKTLTGELWDARKAEHDAKMDALVADGEADSAKKEAAEAKAAEWRAKDDANEAKAARQRRGP